MKKVVGKELEGRKAERTEGRCVLYIHIYICICMCVHEGPLSFASATAGVTVVASVVAVPFSSKTTGLFF